MQYLSGHNLSKGVTDFIGNSETLTLFSAYLKLDELIKINSDQKIKRIIVRWEIQDLCLGASDLELYDYCRNNNIALYRNTRLHLKVFWDNASRIFFGSANVTNRGLGEAGTFNYELNSQSENIGFPTLNYLNTIILKSEFLTEILYKQIKELINEVGEPEIKYPTLNTRRKEIDYFLLSDLPMSSTVEKLYEVYTSPEICHQNDITCAAHDLALYTIPLGMSRQEFYLVLKKNFNNHPFIMALKDFIKQENSVRYGGVVKWIQQHTTTVPTPRSWELKRDEIVNILYEWICFHDDNFSWSVPGGRSQVIFYRGISSTN